MAALALLRGRAAPLRFLAGLIGLETLHPHTGAVALLTPSLAGIERQQSRIGLGKAATAGRTGAASREDLDAARAREDVGDALAELERTVDAGTQRRLLARRAQQRCDRQLDAVFHEALQARERFGRYEFPVNPQLPGTPRGRPARELAIMPLAMRDQRREQLDRLAAMILQQLRDDRLRALRGDRNLAVRAVLRTQSHIDQPQEMINLGQRRHRALEPAATGTLLDGHGGRNAVDGIQIRPRRGLHKLAGIGVEGFEVAALALVEQDVEGQG